ncbi:MAG: CvpA family protein [Planctomycetota bacterium]
MTTADILILIVLSLSALMGLSRGLFKEVFSLASWIGAIFAGLYFACPVSGLLTEQFGNPTLRYGVAFVIVFVVALMLMSLLSFLVGKLIDGSGLGGTDRFFGFVFGALRGGIVCLVVIIALRSFSDSDSFAASSTIIPWLLGFEDALLALLGRAGDAASELRAAASSVGGPCAQ